MSSRNDRPQSRSPHSSPKGSPYRRPLRERSESQANERPDSSRRSIYSKTPFPNLPSQVLPPHGQTYAFEDQTAVSSENAPDSSGNQSTVSGSKIGAPFSARVKQDFSFPESQRFIQPPIRNHKHILEAVPPLLPTKSKERLRQKPVEASPASPSRRAGRSDRTRSPTQQPTASTTLKALPKTPDNSAPSPGRSDDLNREITDAAPANIGLGSHSKLLSRPRSHSSSERSSPRTRRGDLQDGQRGIVTPSHSRSSSNPSHPVNSSHQAVLANTTRLQYLQIRLPSASGFQAENVRLSPEEGGSDHRVMRKRANSNLLKAASSVADPTPQSDQAAVASGAPKPTIHQEASMASLATQASELTSIIPAEAKAWITNQRVSGFSDEMGDTVPELQPPPLRHQKSAVYSDKSRSDSRPNTESSAPSNASSNNLLNSSIATWAKAYYRQGEKLPFTSPSQRSLAPLSTRASSSRLYSAATSGPSHSPGSDGFPDQIYVPRIRPMQRELRNSEDSGITRQEAAQVRSIRPIQPSVERGVSNMSSYTPRLGVDRRFSNAMDQFRPPSFDEGLSTFSQCNRQIVLFCVGFVCPIAWILAAALPIPQRPKWRNEFGTELQNEEASATDLFDPLDVRAFRKANWWRNANRIMSVFGLLVLVAIILYTVLQIYA